MGSQKRRLATATRGAELLLRRTPRARLAVVALAVVWASLAPNAAGGDQKNKPASRPMPFRSQIDRFKKSDAAEPPAKGATLFVGSSSIRRWHGRLARDFPDRKVIGRGFGGSTMGLLLHYFDEIVAPYEPSVIVVYEGDNDLAGPRKVEHVAERFDRFVKRTGEALPEASIVFIAVKPSISRQARWPAMRKLNAHLADLARKHERVWYADIATPMLAGADDPNGPPRARLLASDGLHLSDEGYDLWTRTVGGVLAKVDEARAASRRVRELRTALGADARHRHVDLPMRDGVRLATEIVTPPGQGPWPVVLMRTPYGRWRTTHYAKRYAGKGLAFVVQDLRGRGDSGGKGTFPPADFTVEINDSYDTVEWIADRDWCNGRVGMTGGSGHGMAAAMAYWSRAPHLVAVMPGNTAGHGKGYWLAHNGVRRWTYDWIGHRGGSTADWPRPTICRFDADAWARRTGQAARDNPIVYACDTGWYDTFFQGPLDDFAAIARAGGKAYVVVSPRGHGGLSGLEFPRRRRPVGHPSLPAVLLDANTPWLDKPTLVYDLMGDVRDPNAPGNEWRVVHRWPPPHTPTPLFLDGERLAPDRPQRAGRRAYTYNPNDPAPSLGGHYCYQGDKTGPHDQRPLTRRDDVLTFLSKPLDAPLTITGPIQASLFIDSNAPDTLTVVKLVDVYPDGYQALIRESATMARFGTDPADPRPLKPGEVRELRIDLWDTAYAFAPGHRVGLLVTSSSDPAYEVHPNTFAPVRSMDDARPARNGVHFSPARPSRIVLPVVPASDPQPG